MSSAAVVGRLTAAGQPDPTFGNGTGAVTTDAYVSGDDYATAVALQPDGRIIIRGQYGPYNTDETDAGLARFLPTGRPDTSFNGTGTWTMGQPGKAEALTAGVA